MEMSTGLRCDSKKYKALQKSHKVPKAPLKRHDQGLQTGRRTRRRLPPANELNSRAPIDCYLSNETNLANRLDSVLAIARVGATAESHRRGSRSTWFSVLSPWACCRSAGLRPNVGPGMPKRPAHTESHSPQRTERPRPVARGSST